MHKNHSHLLIAAFAFALIAPVWAAAQEHHQFDEHDRQAAQEWYQRHNTDTRGVRSQDRFSNEEEGRLVQDRPLDREFRHRIHSAPHELVRHLARAPRGYEYVLVGGHVVLMQRHTYVVRDVIHLH